jgi:tetratricopeptide (TPR) repeat protein/predicted Ser/Thr protein kinase
MIGQTISHYKILDKLGEGGMGVVYKAEDLTLGRIVALKFLPTGSITSGQDRARLMHEARAAAALLHPNICPVYEIAETQDRTFIAMAYLDGRNLRDRLTEGPLSVEEALRIIRQVGEALAAAHAKGIVHRDVKPANIMLTKEGQAVLMDFGLAKMSDATKLTKTGMTLGTARYMSPEQALAEDVDLRTDVWSLAAVLYELLTGKPAFPGDYEQAVIYKILHESPEPISIHRSDVPTGIEGVLESALRKNPRERYASVRDFLAGLESRGQQNGEHGSRSGRAASNLLKHPRRIAATLLVIAITAVGVWLLLGRDRPLQGADIALAVIDFEDLGGSSDTLLAAGLGGLLQVGLIERSPIRVVSPEYLRELHRRLFSGAMGAIRQEQAMEVARKAGASYLLSGQIGYRQGSTYAIWRLVETRRGRSVGGRRIVNSDLVGLADGIVAEVVTLVAKQSGVNSPTSTASVGQVTSSSPEALRHFTAAEAALKKGNEDNALRELEAAVRIDSTFALAWLGMADVYWGRTQFIPGREFADKAWALRVRLGIKDRMMLESRRLQLDRKIAAALDIYREMIDRWPDDRTLLGVYASALVWWWYWPEGQIAAEQGIARYPDDEDLRSIRESALIMQGMAVEALASARDYLMLHKGEADAWMRVGSAHLVAGDIDSAEAAWKKARSLVPDDFGTADDMALFAYLRGDPYRAAAIWEDLLFHRNLDPGRRRAIVINRLWGPVSPGLVDCYAETGRLNRALDLLSEMIRVSDPKNVETLVQIDQVRSLLLLDGGRFREVLEGSRKLAKIQDVDYAQDFALLWRTEALVALDSLPAARESLARIRRMKDRYGIFVRYAPWSIAARIALAEGKPDSALAYLDKIKQDLAPREVDIRIRTLRKLGRSPEAAATLENLLRRNGSRFIARYQLGQIYEDLGRKAEAAEQYRIFLKAWEHADPGRPQVEDARKRLAAL